MLSKIINRIMLYLPANPRKVFTRIYKRNVWGSSESVSGPGSTLSVTKNLRKELPLLLRRYNIKTMNDAPCGDCHWISHVDLGGIHYVGIDIVPEVISSNKEKYPGKNFLLADIINDSLPAADLVLSKDCFIHLRNKDVVKVISNFKESGIRWMLASTYPVNFNKRILTGHFRPVNLELPPFNLPAPIEKIADHAEDGTERYLGLWNLTHF